MPDHFIPDDVLQGTCQEKRTWLHNTMAQVIDTFVLMNASDIAAAARGSTPTDVKATYPCRSPDCPRVYQSVEWRARHEKDVHDLEIADPPGVSPSSSADHVKEHTEARLGFGLLLADMQDAVKEGDGERLLDLYKVALLYYRAYNHTQYAYSTLLLLVQIKCTLSPKMAHSIKWNRFYNGRGDKGQNIPVDLHLEHMNNFLKSFLKGLGPNLTENSADRIAKSLGVLKDMIYFVDSELEVARSSGYHVDTKRNEDIFQLVKVFRESEVFTFHPGRAYVAFPTFDRNLLSKMKITALRTWMTSKVSEWRGLYV